MSAETVSISRDNAQNALDWLNDALAQQTKPRHIDSVKEAMTALRAALDAPPHGWQPIETAPKDRTVIDLWVSGRRWTDCYWGKPDHECGEAGEYCDSDWHGAKPGWVDGTFGEFIGTKPTHWQPLPPPPVTAPESQSAKPLKGRWDFVAKEGR